MLSKHSVIGIRVLGIRVLGILLINHLKKKCNTAFEANRKVGDKVNNFSYWFREATKKNSSLNKRAIKA